MGLLNKNKKTDKIVEIQLLNKSNSTVLGATKRLPVVFCLDVSPSMNWQIDGNSSAIELLNVAVDKFLDEIQRDRAISGIIETAIVAYSSTVEVETDFYPVSRINSIRINTVKKGGTRTGEAVLKAYEIIEKQRKQYEESAVSYYAPYFVLITDGDPDQVPENDPLYSMFKSEIDESIKTVRDHCHSSGDSRNIVIPIIIGVGDRIKIGGPGYDLLKRYTSDFSKGFFHAKGNSDDLRINFEKAFNFIGNSVKNSIDIGYRDSIVIEQIKEDFRSLDSIVYE